jgi:preprotein translocase subunit SecG
MYTVLMILTLLASVLLILVVLVQPGKGEMISGMSGLGGAMSSAFGSTRAVKGLQKLTIYLAAIIAGLVLVINLFFVGQSGTSNAPKPVTEGAAVPVTEQTTQTPVAKPQVEKTQEAPVEEAK